MRLRKIITTISLTAAMLLSSAMPAFAANVTDEDSLTLTIETTAEQEEQVDEASFSTPASIQVVLAFRFSDDSLDIWSTGSGVLMDTTHVVAPRTVTSPVSDDEAYETLAKEKKSLYTRLGIDLNDYESVKDSLVIFVSDKDGSYTEAQCLYSNNDINLSILNVEDGVFEDYEVETSDKWTNPMFICGYSTDTLSDTASNIQNDGDTLTVDQNIVETSTSPKDNSLTLDSNMDLGMLGSGIYDADGSLCGVVSGISQNVLTVIPASQVLTFMDNASDGQESSNADVTLADEIGKLELAVERAQNIDLSGFSEESVEAFNAAITDAKDVLKDTKATIDDVTNAGIALNEAKDALAEPEKGIASINMTKIYIMAGIAAGAVVLILIVVILIKNAKKKSDEKKSNESKKNTPTDGRYGGEYARESSQNLAPIKEADDDSDGTSVLNSDANETTILNAHANIKAYFTTENGKRIDITKREFVIGKERKKVSYCISGNSTISRRHCLVKADENGCSIEDLRSLNGTMVNGVSIMPGTPVKLNDGDVITLSDYTLTFHVGE